jgi:hypothetical protein
MESTPCESHFTHCRSTEGDQLSNAGDADRPRRRRGAPSDTTTTARETFGGATGRRRPWRRRGPRGAPTRQEAASCAGGCPRTAPGKRTRTRPRRAAARRTRRWRWGWAGRRSTYTGEGARSGVSGQAPAWLRGGGGRLDLAAAGRTNAPPRAAPERVVPRRSRRGSEDLARAPLRPARRRELPRGRSHRAPCTGSTPVQARQGGV